MQPELTTFLARSDITAAFQFEGDSETTLYNFYPFTRRVRYDWRVVKDGKVVDSGPIVESGASSFTFDAKPGSHIIEVTLSSSYFKGGMTLTVSRSIVVQEEAARRQAAFDSLLAGQGADKPFEYDASGKLKLKPSAQSRTIDDEIKELGIMLGAIEARAGRGEISASDAQAYKKYFEEQIEALRKVKEKTKGTDRYPVHGVFQNRDDGSVRAINAVMNGHEVSAGGGEVGYSVVLHDFTFTPGAAIEHSGSASVEVTADDRRTALAEAERRAIDELGAHWNWYNDLPDGTIQLGVPLLHGSGVRTLVIDTYNVKKTFRKVATGVAVVGGVVALAASGGTAAPVALIVLEGVSLAAGAALAVDSIVERLNTGTLKPDATLVLDMLSLVPLAGTLARAAGRPVKGMMLVQIGSGVAEFALISHTTRQAITATMAQYEALIERAPTPEEKARLESERDVAIARILGGAAVSGGLSLVSTAVAVKGAASGAPHGKPSVDVDAPHTKGAADAHAPSQSNAPMPAPETTAPKATTPAPSGAADAAADAAPPATPKVIRRPKKPPTPASAEPETPAPTEPTKPPAPKVTTKPQRRMKDGEKRPYVADTKSRPLPKQDPVVEQTQRRSPRPSLEPDEATAEAMRSSQSAREKALERYGEFKAKQRKKTVAAEPSGGITISGYKQIAEVETQATVQAVKSHSKEIGHESPGHVHDPKGGAKGDYYSSHAEKKRIVDAPNQPVGVSRPMCEDCIPFFRKEAAHRGRTQVVSDPECTRVFEPDGTITEYWKDGSAVRLHPDGSASAVPMVAQ